MKSKRGLLLVGVSCIVMAGLLCPTSSFAQAQQQFLTAPIYASGGFLKAVGDFNKDGKLDLVTVSSDGSTISVLLGNGDGSFEPPLNLGAGALCCSDSAVVVGDFNGDGNLDIAFTAFGNPMCSGFDCQDTVSIFLGNGDGTFRPRIDSPAGGFLSVFMAVGDFNGDGKLDLVTGSIQDPSQVVSVLLGNGDGTFQPPMTFTTGGAPQSLAVGDFNGDGKADLVVVSFVNGAPNLSIFISKGDGTFLPPVNYATSSSPGSVVIADVNSDGKPDLVVICAGGISVLLGNGNGTFQPHLDYTTLDFPTAVVVADFNGDGKPDLAFTMDHQTVAVGFGNGDGTFQAPVTYEAGTEFFGPSGIVVGDFNGDGKPDLAVGDGSPHPPQSTVSVLLNNGKGGFQAARRFAVGSTPYQVALADLNGDGKLDLVVKLNPGGLNPGVGILLGNGDGTFAAEADFSGGGIGIGDFNGDGIPDLTDGATVLLGKGDGTFGAPISTGAPPGPVGVGDFNGDGKLDMAIANGGNTIGVLLGKGDGTFQPPVNYVAGPGAGAGSIAVADFNGDGKPDLAVVIAADQTTPAGCMPAASAACGGVAVLINRGDGTFLSPVVYSSGGISIPTAIAIGDFNMDGHPDLAVANGGLTCSITPDGIEHCTADHSLGILLGNGDGTFQTAATYQTGAEPISVVVADFNGDGKPDVAVANPDCLLPGGACRGSTISMLWGNGDGTLRKRLDYHVGPVPLALAAGDLNGDSKPDLVAVIGANATNLHPATNAVTALLNTASAPANVLSAAVSFTGPDIGGTVSSQPTQIMCGEECSASYAPGTSVTLTPQPIPLDTFTGWSGDCTGMGACVVDMNADRSVVANFSPSTTTYTLKIILAGNGTGAVGTSPPGCTRACSNSIPVGAPISLGALPDPGSTFAGWSGAGCTAGMIACVFTMNSDVTVTATFNAASPPPDFSLQAASASLTAQRGAQVTDVITIATQNGFSKPIQLSCAVTGSTPLANCSLTPNSVTPGASSVTSTLTITAPTQSARLIPRSEGQPSRPLYAVFLPIPLSLIGLGLASCKSRNRTRSLLLLCSLTLALVVLQVGCGGEGSAPPPPPPLNYTVTVTANSGAIQHTTQVTVSVQ